MARNEFLNMTPEERREAGRKGGIASGEAKRRKKAMRERLEVLLELPLKSGKRADLDNIKNLTALKGANITVEDAVMLAQIQKALKGDTAAAIFVRDTVGEKPGDAISLSGRVDTGTEMLSDIIRQLSEK